MKACAALVAISMSLVSSMAMAQKASTQEELVRQLGAEAGLDEQKANGLRSQLESELAMRSLLEKRARAAGLDKLPRVAASVELAKQNALAQAYLEQMEKRLVPTEAELRSDYNSAYPEKRLAQVRFAIYTSEDKAAKGLDALKKGSATIEELARLGDDKLLAQKQGDFGMVPFDAMPDGVAAVIGAAPTKKWPDKPIKTMYGHMLYQLEGVKSGREKTYEAAKPELDSRRRQLMMRVELAKLRIEAQKPESTSK
jgi:hypothetical protein